MLEAIRKHTTGIVVKLFLGLLILSFAVWGIGDVVRSLSAPSNVVASVGGVEIPPEQVSNEYRREIDRLSRIFGDQFDSEQARSLGVGNAVLGGIINNTLFGLAAGDLGIAISDKIVGDEIRQDEAFKGILGKFDRVQYQQVLQSNGYSEKGFEARTRKDLARAMLIESITSGSTAPDSLVEILYRHRKEKRMVKTMKITDQSMTAIDEPDYGTLDSYHQENRQRFTAPEYRSLGYIVMLAEDLAREIAVSDDQIREAYDQRADEFGNPERRHLQQILVSDEAEARLVHEELAKGRDFKEIAKEVAGMDEAATDLGMNTKDQILPELVISVFAVLEGEFTQPIQSPLGWHVIRVAAIEDESIKSLDQVREELKADIAREMAVDGLYKLASRLEDLLGGGATLEEAALQLNLKLNAITAVDRNGLDGAGQRIADLPGQPFLETAFATFEGMESPLSDTGEDGYFILRVDSITEPRVRPLDTVRGKVAAAWKAERRAEAAKAEAEALLVRLRNGEDMAGLASEKGLLSKSPKAFTRGGEGASRTLPAELTASIFNLEVGQYAIARTSDGYLVARLEQVIAAYPAADKEGFAGFKREIADSLRNDIVFQFAGALRERYPVNVNTRVLDQIY